MKTLEKKSLFWDVDSVDPVRNQEFILERIFDYGDIDDFKWALGYYGKKALVKSLEKCKSISKKSLFFWCQYFNLNKEKCSANQSTKTLSAFWKR